MTITIQRRTLYALLSELELDLRNVITAELLPTLQMRLLTEDERSKAYDRFVRDQGAASDPASIEDLIDHLDLGDLGMIIHRHISVIPNSVRPIMNKVCNTVLKIVPIRNRVMHSRPLDFDDFATVFEFCKETTRTLPDRWQQLRQLLREMRNDPYCVSRYPIPVLEDSSPTFHNLPSPDFDDTGFIGRQAELAQLIDALKGPYPVITVLGEGGVGKTALALKACYMLLDQPAQYDAFIWVTAKANRLTSADIEDIDGAIKTSSGLIEAASNALVRQDTDPLDDLYLNLEHHRVLLVLDNLETVLDDKIRDFVRRIPSSSRSKILITTRVGLGAYNFPIELRQLDRRDSRLFFRRTAKVWQVNDFATLSDERVQRYCDQLQNNPLFIKWFMQTIKTGKRPEAILANPKILLQYCLQNVFSFLTEDSKLVAWALLTVGGRRPQSAIAYITGLSNERVEFALTNLLSANVVSMRPASTIERDATYALSPLSQSYLAGYMPPSKALQKDFLQKNNRLRSAKDEFDAPIRVSVYSTKNVAVRDEHDIPAAMKLKKAVESLLLGDPVTAMAQWESAAQLSPTYFEVKRVEALIAVHQRNFVKAEGCYSAAIALAANHAPLRLWYAGFLARSLQDHEKALVELEKAIELDPDASFLHLELARLFLYRRLFDEAEETLRKVEDVDTLTSRQQRQLVDLKLQIHTRRADILIDTERYGPALEEMEALKQDFESYEARLIDDKTVANVCKCNRYVGKLAHRLYTSQERERWMIVSNWLKDLCVSDPALTVGTPGQQEKKSIGSLEGRVMKLLDGYGFIDSSEGRFFFHGNSFADHLDIRDLRIGDHVIFDLGYNHQGTCAVNVRLSP